LEFYRLPFLIVLTKIDKVTRNELGRRQRRIGEDLGLSTETPLISFSAKTSAGRDLLWREIEKVLASDPEGGS
jgi:GTP-binding protein